MIGNEACAAAAASDQLAYYFSMSDAFVNTQARANALAAFNAVLGGFLGSELPSCAP